MPATATASVDDRTTLVVAIAARGSGLTDDATKKTPEQLKKGIENQHPATYYILAQKLFESGKKEDRKSVV